MTNANAPKRSSGKRLDKKPSTLESLLDSAADDAIDRLNRLRTAQQVDTNSWMAADEALLAHAEVKERVYYPALRRIVVDPATVSRLERQLEIIDFLSNRIRQLRSKSKKLACIELLIEHLQGLLLRECDVARVAAFTDDLAALRRQADRVRKELTAPDGGRQVAST